MFISYMKWQTKLRYYQHYLKTYSHVSDLDRPFEIEKILCRNEALRTNNRQLYQSLLIEQKIETWGEEMDLFDQTAESLVLLEQQHLQQLMTVCQVNMLQSDIWIDDEDCIFKLINVPEQDVLTSLDRTLTAIVGVNLLPQEIVGNAYAWLDISTFDTELARQLVTRYTAKLAS